MQERKPDEKLSRLRVTLLALLEHLREVLNVALARTPLVKGNVYEIARRCGTPNCSCMRGRLHRNMVLTWSEQGRSEERRVGKECRCCWRLWGDDSEAKGMLSGGATGMYRGAMRTA